MEALGTCKTKDEPDSAQASPNLAKLKIKLKTDTHFYTGRPVRSSPGLYVLGDDDQRPEPLIVTSTMLASRKPMRAIAAAVRWPQWANNPKPRGHKRIPHKRTKSHQLLQGKVCEPSPLSYAFWPLRSVVHRDLITQRIKLTI